MATLKVYSLYAQELRGDLLSTTDNSVIVIYSQQKKKKNSAYIEGNDDLKWPDKFEFGPITIIMATKLTFKLYDYDTLWVTESLGTCSFELHSGEVSDICVLEHSTFLFFYKVECAPSLGEHIFTPMSPSLAEVFHTRNGVLAGESWLPGPKKGITHDEDSLLKGSKDRNIQVCFCFIFYYESFDSSCLETI